MKVHANSSVQAAIKGAKSKWKHLAPLRVKRGKANTQTAAEEEEEEKQTRLEMNGSKENKTKKVKRQMDKMTSHRHTKSGQTCPREYQKRNIHPSARDKPRICPNRQTSARKWSEKRAKENTQLKAKQVNKMQMSHLNSDNGGHKTREKKTGPNILSMWNDDKTDSGSAHASSRSKSLAANDTDSSQQSKQAIRASV